MSRNHNPRELSDSAVRQLIEQDKCPMCIGDLGAGFECNSCGYDAGPLIERIAEKAQLHADDFNPWTLRVVANGRESVMRCAEPHHKTTRRIPRGWRSAWNIFWHGDYFEVEMIRPTEDEA